MSRFIPYRSPRTPYEKREVVVRLVGGPLDGRRRRVFTLQSWFISKGGLWYSNNHDGTFSYDECTTRGTRACRDDDLWKEHLEWLSSRGEP